MDRLRYYAVVEGVPRLLSTTGEIPDGTVPIADGDPLIELANCGGDKGQIDSFIRQRCDEFGDQCD